MKQRVILIELPLLDSVPSDMTDDTDAMLGVCTLVREMLRTNIKNEAGAVGAFDTDDIGVEYVEVIVSNDATKGDPS